MSSRNSLPTSRAVISRFFVAVTLLLTAGVASIVPQTASAQERLELPVERTGEFLASIAGSPFVSPVPSAALFEPGQATPADLRPFTIGRTPGTAGGGYTWQDREVPAQDIYAFRISDPDTRDQDKPVVVLMGGQHPNESHSLYALEGTIQVLVDPADPVGQALRSKADFYVYPQVNPEGRWARTGRGNPENPRQDNNRAWSDPSGWTNIIIARNAMRHDTEGRQVRYLFDYHAPGHTSSSLFHYATEHSAQGYWAQFSENGGIRISIAGGGPDLAYGWSMLPRAEDGLGVKYGYTPEIGRLSPESPEAYRQIGVRMALAMARSLAAAQQTEPPPAGVEIRFDFDNGRVPSSDGWNVVATTLGGNTYPVIDHRGQVLGARFTVPENLERTRSGQWPAGAPLPDWADRAAADGHVSFTETIILVVEGLGPARTFTAEVLRSRQFDSGYHSEVIIIEDITTDAHGRFRLEFPAGGPDLPGIVNALRIVEQEVDGAR